MSDTIKIEIEIPAPPEGWGEVEYRHIDRVGDELFWNGADWVKSSGQGYQYPVARKLTPLWTPPRELVDVLKPGWLTRDIFDVHALHAVAPNYGGCHWTSEGAAWRLSAINPNLLPPLTIPCEKCCFKIGEPKE